MLNSGHYIIQGSIVPADKKKKKVPADNTASFRENQQLQWAVALVVYSVNCMMSNISANSGCFFDCLGFNVVPKSIVVSQWIIRIAFLQPGQVIKWKH